MPHDGDLLHAVFLYHLQLNGVQVVRRLVAPEVRPTRRLEPRAIPGAESVARAGARGAAGGRRARRAQAFFRKGSPVRSFSSIL